MRDFFYNEALTKQSIRSKILLKLKTHKEEDRNRKSNLIKKKLFRSVVFKKAKTIMFFVSFGGEVNTKDMIKETLNLGKIVTAPVCKRKRWMMPCIVRENTKFIKGLYEVYEPASKKFVVLEDLDLVIVPGIAFDKRGSRLGRGKGYYDCFLHKLPPRTISIGLAFDFQILSKIPANSDDKKVHKVIFA